jgi:hypothetical protein
MTHIDKIAQRLQQIHWLYGDRDPVARAEMLDRIVATAKKLGLITYSDLVRGLTFRLPTVRDGAPFSIDTHEWTGLDRRVVGDFLGHISMETYLNAGFMASALVVSRQTFAPSDLFFEWMEELKVLPNLKEDTVLAFWAEQVHKPHQWYSTH